LEYGDAKEIAMLGFEVIVVLMFVRVILPVAVLLCIGDYIRRQESIQRAA
jgi:hypothetical protein